MSTTQQHAAPEERVKLATQAYVYGYPLVYGLEEIARFPAGEATLLPGKHPFNEFGVRKDLCGPETRFVSPNNDTIYMFAPLDLSGGPLLLHVPDTHDRYYVLQFIDAWSNNFAYIGRRATGTEEATFLIAPPGWKGEAPDGIKDVIEVPTTICIVFGRIAVSGEADLPAVQELGARFTLTPLGGNSALRGIEMHREPEVAHGLDWWEKFRQAVRQFWPLPPSDTAVVPMLEELGVTAAESPYMSPDPELAEVLKAGAEAGLATIEHLMENVPTTPSGWQSAMHLFDYNVDFLGIGTIDSAEWKIADPMQRYATRAIVARGGLWGNHGYEAEYKLTWVDADGDRLDGSNRYELRLETPPPVGAFWSLTMYDLPNFYLVANPIDRYSIGDRTPGLEYGDDGSVTIYLQKDSPGPDKESNWLPTPAGGFRPIMRMYEPHEEILDGSYQLPPITKVG